MKRERELEKAAPWVGRIIQPKHDSGEGIRQWLATGSQSHLFSHSSMHDQPFPHVSGIPHSAKTIQA